MDKKLGLLIKGQADLLNKGISIGDKIIIKSCLEYILLNMGMLCFVYDFDVDELQRNAIELYRNENY